MLKRWLNMRPFRHSRIDSQVHFLFELFLRLPHRSPKSHKPILHTLTRCWYKLGQFHLFLSISLSFGTQKSTVRYLVYFFVWCYSDDWIQPPLISSSRFFVFHRARDDEERKRGQRAQGDKSSSLLPPILSVQTDTNRVKQSRRKT